MIKLETRKHDHELIAKHLGLYFCVHPPWLDYIIISPPIDLLHDIFEKTERIWEEAFPAVWTQLKPARLLRYGPRGYTTQTHYFFTVLQLSKRGRLIHNVTYCDILGRTDFAGKQALFASKYSCCPSWYRSAFARCGVFHSDSTLTALAPSTSRAFADVDEVSGCHTWGNESVFLGPPWLRVHSLLYIPQVKRCL